MGVCPQPGLRILEAGLSCIYGERRTCGVRLDWPWMLLSGMLALHVVWPLLTNGAAGSWGTACASAVFGGWFPRGLGRKWSVALLEVPKLLRPEVLSRRTSHQPSSGCSDAPISCRAHSGPSGRPLPGLDAAPALPRTTHLWGVVQNSSWSVCGLLPCTVGFMWV